MQIEWCVYVFGLLSFKINYTSFAGAIFLCAPHNYIHPAIDISTNDKTAFMKFDAYCLCSCLTVCTAYTADIRNKFNW